MSDVKKDAYTSYRPLSGKVLLRPIIVDEGAIENEFLPENFIVPEYHAEVVSVGKHMKEVKLQEVVIYPKYGTTEIKLNGEDLLIINEKDILLITDKSVSLTEPATEENLNHQE